MLIENPNTRGVKGWCLEIHDLLCAKYIAGREKDRVFGRAVFRHRLAQPRLVAERVRTVVAVVEAVRQAALTAIAADADAAT